jgi:methylated-DNA-[protein]-cysteine S-methyltransferase
MSVRNAPAQSLALDQVDTPIGPVLVVAQGDALVALDFADCAVRMHQLLVQRVGTVAINARRNPAGLSVAVRRYFDGQLDALHAIALAMHGTAFQQSAWQALREVPPGSAVTYIEQARRLGRPGAARAVGRANALNPIAIAIPCHRLIGSDGSLTGYAGGLARKRWLLRHEGFAQDSHAPC